MDDLVGALLVAAAAALVIAAAAAVAAAMVVAGATVGAVSAGALGVGAFSRSFGNSLVARGGPNRKPKDPEPAFELYVLGQLRRDVITALESGRTALKDFIATCARQADKWSHGATIPLAVGIVVGSWTGAALAALIGALLALPIVIIAAIFSGIAWLVVGFLRGLEWLRRRIRKAHYECPHDHERFPIPVYVCPSCGAEHRRLVPGRWGVLRRECSCGSAALPTMVLNGRQRIPQQCPSGHPMSGLIGYAENLPVALVGGPSSGKTTFLAAASMELELLAASGHFAIDVMDESRSAYETALQALRSGTVPRKTQGQNPALVAEVQGEGRPRAMYVYDVAGESYGDSDAARELRFLEVPSGIVLLIDPLAIPHVAAQYSDEIAAQQNALLPSTEDPMRVVERTLAALHEAGVDASKMPVAVVVAKADAFGIADEVAAQGAAGVEAPTRAWLEQHGAGNLVRTVEQEFKQAAWFTCSALGRTPTAGDTTPFVPQGAVPPLLWVLERRGVTPARRPFAAAHTQQKLASSGTFPPIGRRGWAWRGALSAAGTAAILGAAAVGAVAIGNSVGGHTSTADANSNDVVDTAPVSDNSDPGGDPGTSGTDDPAVDTPVAPRVPTQAERAEHVIRKHYQDLDEGKYSAAFALTSPAYQGSNAGWVSNRKTGDPSIDVLSAGSPRVHGGQGSVRIHFYAQDRYPAPRSDTRCREFSGRATVIKVGDNWRFDPHGSDYTSIEHPDGDAHCPL